MCEKFFFTPRAGHFTEFQSSCPQNDYKASNDKDGVKSHTLNACSSKLLYTARSTKESSGKFLSKFEALLQSVRSQVICNGPSVAHIDLMVSSFSDSMGVDNQSLYSIGVSFTAGYICSHVIIGFSNRVELYH